MIISVNTFYKNIFHKKVYKISLDAGCTCPTRDGTLATGGCIFCSAAGSGEFTANHVEEKSWGSAYSESDGQENKNRRPVREQVEKAKAVVSRKSGKDAAAYIAYFQSFTNTYGDIEKLYTQWKEALDCDDIAGIAIATRPDCLSDECLKKLGELAEETFVQVELGLQTSNDTIAKRIRRGYDTAVYLEAVSRLHKINPKIHVVSHIIFGLPEESRESMLQTVKTAVSAGTDGIKIAELYVLKGTELYKEYEEGNYFPLSMEEYFSLLKKALPLIPEKVVVHRLTGDPPKSLLAAPQWPCNKKLVLNQLNKLISAY